MHCLIIDILSIWRHIEFHKVHTYSVPVARGLATRFVLEAGLLI